MRDIPIQAIPNQRLAFNFGQNRWELAIKDTGGCMAIDVTLNDELVIQGWRLVAGSPVIPFEYLQTNGNFWFLTDNDELPWWENFGVDQQLVFAEPGELDA
jgi:hypothetical protein